MNGVLDSNTAATLALLADTSRAGNRGGFLGGGGEGGYGGGGYLAATTIADGTATNARVVAGNAATAAGIENLLDQNQFAITNKSVSEGHNRICDHMAQDGNRVSDGMFRAELRTSDMIAAIKDGQFAAELRTGDRLRDIEREMSANARAAAECCCDAKLEACKSHAEIMATVIRENSATRELIRGDALAAANAKVTQLETINALSGHGHR